MTGKKILIYIIAFILIGGTWYYLRNYTKVMSKDSIYYGYFDDVRGLQGSAPIFVKGVKIGHVDEVDLIREKKVKVTFAIWKKMRLPKGTIANIGSGEITGGKAINLTPGKGPGFIEEYAILQTGFDSTAAEMFNSKITPLLHNGKQLLHNADSALHDFNALMLYQHWGLKTQEQIAAFNKRTAGISDKAGEINASTKNFTHSLDNVDSMFSNPADKNRKLNDQLGSSDKKMADVAKKPFKEDMEKLGNSFSKLAASIKKVSSNKWISDKQAYEKMSSSADTLNKGVKEYKANPPSPIRLFSK
jgi:phospholipid/cholesterol/gamma-HCH transport system substrate-binding protein